MKRSLAPIVIAAVALLPFQAAAQTAPPQTLDQRIGAQIGALVIQNSQLALQLEQTQAALKSTQDRMKALEDKYEPKKDSAK